MITWFREQPITIRAAIVGAAIPGAVAIIVAIGSVVVRQHVPEVRGDSALRVVDVTVLETAEFPKLDIKLRNVGDQVAFVKQAAIRVDQIWTISAPLLPYAQEVSWNYDVILPVTTTPYTVRLPLSQSVDSGTADRFTITLGTEASTETIAEYVFLIDVELAYDEDNKSVALGAVAFATPGPISVFAATGAGGEFYLRTMARNKAIVREIEGLDVATSERLRDLMDAIRDAPNSATR